MDLPNVELEGVVYLGEGGGGWWKKGRVRKETGEGG